jgi:hypothetical protein
MSGINGDKSRFHRERKKKIARRKRNQELASQQLQPVCGHPASQKPTSGARGADVRGPEIQLPAWTAGFQNPAAAQVSPASPLSEPETRTGPRRFASRLSEFPSAETDLQKHRLTVLRSSLSGGLARYPAGLKTLPPHLVRQRGTQVCLPETQAAWRGAAHVFTKLVAMAQFISPIDENQVV